MLSLSFSLLLFLFVLVVHVVVKDQISQSDLRFLFEIEKGTQLSKLNSTQSLVLEVL